MESNWYRRSLCARKKLGVNRCTEPMGHLMTEKNRFPFSDAGTINISSSNYIQAMFHRYKCARRSAPMGTCYILVFFLMFGKNLIY